jgi:hypothetical protein
MPLEFALRPRINLERPAPQRRLRRLRLPPFALPIVAYWLAIAVVTHAFLRGPERHATAESAQLAGSAYDSEVADLSLRAAPAVPSASFPSAAATAAMSPPSEPEPSAQPEPKPEPKPEAAPPERGAPALEPSPTEHLASAHRALTSPVDAPLRSVEPSPRASEQPTPSAREEESKERRSEILTPALNQQRGRDAARAGSLPSCESVVAAANETMDLGSTLGAPDLTRGAFAAVLENGRYLARCAVPARTQLEICAAVREGRVVGVSATTEPRSPEINACVRSAVAALRFPVNSRLDVTHTRFEATP